MHLIEGSGNTVDSIHSLDRLIYFNSELWTRTYLNVSVISILSRWVDLKSLSLLESFLFKKFVVPGFLIVYNLEQIVIDHSG